MRRTLYLLYGVVAYAFFFCTFLYAIGFVGNFLVPTALDAPARGPLGEAIAVNLALLAVFAVQHSVMARPAFKRWWTRFVPEPIERSTYVLLASAALIALFWLWRPMGGTVWNITDSAGRAAMLGLFGAGWLIVLICTCLINHFDLFGLRQVWLYFRGRPYEPLRFVVPGPYKMVRHPMYIGWLLAFWATPTMTLAHLLFAVMTTAYIFIAIQLEERDLVTIHGRQYAEYRRQVPMMVPRAGRAREAERIAAEA